MSNTGTFGLTKDKFKQRTSADDDKKGWRMDFDDDAPKQLKEEIRKKPKADVQKEKMEQVKAGNKGWRMDFQNENDNGKSIYSIIK